MLVEANKITWTHDPGCKFPTVFIGYVVADGGGRFPRFVATLDALTTKWTVTDTKTLAETTDVFLGKLIEETNAMYEKERS